MPDPPRPELDLHLVLVRGSDPITGHLGPADGVATPFTGWLELASAIDRAHGTADDRTA